MELSLWHAYPTQGRQGDSVRVNIPSAKGTPRRSAAVAIGSFGSEGKCEGYKTQPLEAGHGFLWRGRSFTAALEMRCHGQERKIVYRNGEIKNIQLVCTGNRHQALWSKVKPSTLSPTLVRTGCSRRINY